jgi:hypothetical protein
VHELQADFHRVSRAILASMDSLEK